MNPARKFFLAIRHKPSGGLLPSVKGYGFTRTSPSLTEAPRLFTKMGPAKQALSYWLEGEMTEDPRHDPTESNEMQLRLKHCADRKPEEMEIVEIELVVRSYDESVVQLRRL